MKVKAVLVGIGLAGLGMVLSGCQQTLCSEGKRLAEEGKRREAVIAYKQCRESEKNASRRAEINEAIRALTPAIVGPVIEKVDRQPPRTVGQYKRAIADLADVQPYDEPGEPWGVAGKIKVFEDQCRLLEEEVQDLLGKASEKSREQQWKEAVDLVELALVKDPERAELQTLRRQILAGRDGYFSTQIATLCGAERWKDAAEVLERLKAEKPQPEAGVIRKLTEMVEKKKGEVIRRDAKKDIDEKRYFQAYTRIMESQAPGCGDLLKTIEEDGWRHYVAVARSMSDEARFFHAYIAAEKAMKLPKPPATATEDPENIVFELHRDCADLVDDSIQVEICIAAFDSPESDAVAGREFADRLVNDLHPLLPYGLHLDDRRRVEYTTGGNKEKMRDALQLVGASWAVQGSLSMNFVRDRQERDKTEWVPVKQTIANPQYDTDIRDFEKQYGEDHSKWPRQPARTITEELTEKVVYKTGAERMEGEITVSANIYSAAEGSIAASRSFRVAEDVNDAFSDGIDQAGIKADPLEMKSQLTFKQQLEEKMRKEVAAWVLSCFGPRQKLFCEEALRRADRREWDQAVQAATQGYYYCLQSKTPPEDQWFSKLRQLALFELTEFASGRRTAGM